MQINIRILPREKTAILVDLIRHGQIASEVKEFFKRQYLKNKLKHYPEFSV